MHKEGRAVKHLIGSKPRFDSHRVPLAELVIVTVLFWTIISLNVTSDVLGNVLLSGQTFEGAWQVVRLNENLHRHPAKPVLQKLEGEGPAIELIADHETKVVRRRRNAELNGLEAIRQVRVPFSART